MEEVTALNYIEEPCVMSHAYIIKEIDTTIIINDECQEIPNQNILTNDQEERIEESPIDDNHDFPKTLNEASIGQSSLSKLRKNRHSSIMNSLPILAKFNIE